MNQISSLILFLLGVISFCIMWVMPVNLLFDHQNTGTHLIIWCLSVSYWVTYLIVRD